MSFDRIAPHYRWMEAILVGGLLQRCRTRWLSEVMDARNVLLAGEGHGRTLEAGAALFHGAQITVLDQSQGMIEVARSRVHELGLGVDIRFVQADVRDWYPPRREFDLLVCHFFLDCFRPGEVRRISSVLAAAAKPRARLLLSDFALPPSGWRRARAQAVLAVAYAFFRLAAGISAKRLTPPEEALRESGFGLKRRESFNFGLLHSDLWERRD